MASTVAEIGRAQSLTLLHVFSFALYHIPYRRGMVIRAMQPGLYRRNKATTATRLKFLIRVR
jgi:hypothetical protein